MAQPPLVSIIVVNWNGHEFLDRCLRAVRAQTLADYRVVFVDNGSTDGSADWVAAHFPEVDAIRLAQNIGFAGANNTGIAASTSRYVATLNNDTWVGPGWLAALVGAAESDEQIGMCASRILLADRPSVIDSAGLFVDGMGFAWQRGHGQSDAGAYRRPEVIFGPSAAAALYRRAMLDRIGGFDVDFGSYYEDVDLAWRARRNGWRCRYAPDAEVLHVHSATGRRDPDRKMYLLTRNRWWTVAKNYPTPRLWLALPLMLACDLAVLLRDLGRRRGRAPVAARIEAARGMRRMWRKRQQLNESTRDPERHR